MENAELRKHFKMNHELTGILVNETNTVSASHKIQKKNDVILAIDGVPIGNDALDGREYTFRTSYIAVCHIPFQ
ncbi:hypothetical protein Bca52824_035832 [Brassica carinata]|uniref:PDZ domain-containing protein n=1 Tax=Brassica carinata TaxID=52824 RepID=A0A8X7S3K2_BRACI|nr:hypothetical protein Bca52824_035832 [Brassica carinata]